MAGELNTFFNGSATIYATVRSPGDSGTVWNGSAFVAFVNGDIANYDIPLTSRGGDFYSADFPSGIANGTPCEIAVYEQAGGSPAITDLLLRSYTHVAGSATVSLPTGDDLTTTARFKTYKNITVSTYDTAIGYLVTAVSHFITLYCERESFHSDTYTTTFDGTGRRSFFLPETPITALTTVLFDANEATTDSHTGSEFDYNAKTGEIRFKPTATNARSFNKGFQNLTITYTGGYATIPANLELACWRAIEFYFNASQTNANVKREKIGDYEIENFENAIAMTSGFSIDPALETIRVQLAAGGYYRPHVCFET